MAELLCIGNAMVDVFAEVPADFCKRFALTSPVQHITAEKAAAILSELPSDVVKVSGGSAANTARVAAHLGVSAAYIGAVGSDCNAVFFEEALKRAGVHLHLVHKKSPTGVFINLSCKSPEPGSAEFSRCIAASPSAALELGAEDITETLFKGEDAPRVLVLDGFLLVRDRLVKRILELAEKHRLSIALDIGTAEIAAEQARLMLQKRSLFWDGSYQFPLIFFLNEAEAEAFAGALGTNWERFFAEASRTTGSASNADGASFAAVAVKRAERGAAVFSGGRVYHIQAEPVEMAESTGAGDAFAAGFLSAWLRGESPEQCGRAGNAAAALVLKAPGTAI